jgi:acyl carrier protein
MQVRRMLQRARQPGFTAVRNRSINDAIDGATALIMLQNAAAVAKGTARPAQSSGRARRSRAPGRSQSPGGRARVRLAQRAADEERQSGVSEVTSVADRVVALAEQISGCEANPDSRLVDDLGLDSLDLIQLAINLEEAFGIEIPDDDVDDPALGVVSGLIAYVERKVALRGLYQQREVADGRMAYSPREGVEL